jgi:hypothetical protein
MSVPTVLITGYFPSPSECFPHHVTVYLGWIFRRYQYSRFPQTQVGLRHPQIRTLRDQR